MSGEIGLTATPSVAQEPGKDFTIFLFVMNTFLLEPEHGITLRWSLLLVPKNFLRTPAVRRALAVPVTLSGRQ